MGALANSLTDKEKNDISRECEKFLRIHPKLSEILLFLTEEEKKWIHNYLSSGKGTIPYELITEFDSLDIVPDNEDFFLGQNCFSSLKHTVFSDEEYEKVKKFY